MSTNNNPTGKNGYGPKNCSSTTHAFFHESESFSRWWLSFKDPDDETLKTALHQYAKEKLTTAQRLARLEVEHNFIIKSVNFHRSLRVISIDVLNRSALLYKLNNKFGVPSVRKLPPIDIATQAVLEKVADDPSQGRGVGTIGVLLSNDGIPLPRLVRGFIPHSHVTKSHNISTQGFHSKCPGNSCAWGSFSSLSWCQSNPSVNSIIHWAQPPASRRWAWET